MHIVHMKEDLQDQTVGDAAAVLGVWIDIDDNIGRTQSQD